MRKALKKSLLIHGRAVLPGGRAGKRYLYVENGTLRSVSAERPEVPAGTLEVETASSDWIFPGLLDLHSHAD